MQVGFQSPNLGFNGECFAFDIETFKAGPEKCNAIETVEFSSQSSPEPLLDKESICPAIPAKKYENISNIQPKAQVILDTKVARPDFNLGEIVFSGFDAIGSESSVIKDEMKLEYFDSIEGIEENLEPVDEIARFERLDQPVCDSSSSAYFGGNISSAPTRETTTSERHPESEVETVQSIRDLEPFQHPEECIEVAKEEVFNASIEEEDDTGGDVSSELAAEPEFVTFYVHGSPENPTITMEYTIGGTSYRIKAEENDGKIRRILKDHRNLIFSSSEPNEQSTSSILQIGSVISTLSATIGMASSWALKVLSAVRRIAPKNDLPLVRTLFR